MAGATSIYFNGRLTYTPGSYSAVDASALEAVGLGASGYVVVIGTAVGGLPYNAIDPNDVAGTIQKSTRPGQAKTFFLSGNLLEAEALAFAPSNDADIPGGAQRLYYLKVNKSTQSTTNRALGAGNNAAVNILNTDGSFYADLKAILDAINNRSDLITAAKSGVNMVLTSEEYGYHTTRINFQQGAGSVQGYMITITYETTAEVFDNVGGDAIFTLEFTAPGAPSYTTLTGTVSGTELTTAFTISQVGKSADFVGNVIVVGYADEHKVELLSSSVADVGDVTLYGINGAGAAVTEVVTLQGTTVVQSANSYNLICAVVIDAAPTGTVTVRNLGGGAVITTLTPLILSRGYVSLSGCTVTGTVYAEIFPANLLRAVVVGLDASAAAAVEKVTHGDTTTTIWSSITGLALGELPASRTLVISGTAWSYTHAAYDTVTKMAEKVNNAQPNFTMTVKTPVTTFAMTDMDYAPTSGPPANTAAPVYLAGGNEGSAVAGAEGTPTATITDWQTAIDLLTKLYVNTLVPLTHDAAVHSYVKAHCAYMCGAGSMERDAIVGLLNAGGTSLPTKAEIKTQIINLNTRHIRAVAQQTEVYNSSGTKTKMDPAFLAVQAAGMQAGSDVGTSLTYKYINTLGIYGHSSWNPVDDSDEMIELGLMFARTVDGVGRRWVRNITTYLQSTNVAFSEGSVNEAANYSTYNLRTSLESAVGQKGFAGTIQAADGVARNVLSQLMGLAITSWRSLSWILISDVLECSVEIAPVVPVNFVKTTIHLYNAPQTA